MDDAWQILRDGGLPLAEPTTDAVRSAPELASAVRAAIASAPHGRQADALAAYILAWCQHWPTSFASELAGDASTTEAWARAQASDPNRYLKLRRIALERLARVL